VDDTGVVHKKKRNKYAVGTTIEKQEKKERKTNKKKRSNAHSDLRCLGQNRIDVVVKGKGE